MTLSTILIANRGEIARRIIRACQRLGLRSIAVYSDADRDAPFVADADLAVHIGPSEAAQSYLDGEKIIAAALRAGAEAIHPGYGFLAENAEFAAACEKAGLVFIGPSPDNIRLMGSKIAAKAAAVDAGVPVVPGYSGDDQSDDILEREAGNVGTPLLIKASAGGGGRGMRQVHDLADFKSELALARSEAAAAFGDDKVLLERYVAKARHIEVQILADRTGNVLHLFERDCSLQRNHQKVIEEAPAPNLPEKTRADLLASAVRLSAGIGYSNAGTVEYLLDDESGKFYFLEMNARLQVEHPVTEIVTGIDIVEWQIRTARGEALPFAQDDITCTGWAVEARVAAEDPANGYLPETGILDSYHEPSFEGLRIDSGIQEGSRVSHFYDSLLAKVIGSGADRDQAVRRLHRGLGAMEITGVGTNVNFLRDLLETSEFANGDHSTASLGRIYPDGWSAPQATPLHRAEAVLARQLISEQANTSDPWHNLGAWRVTEPAGRDGAAYYHLGDEQIRISGRCGRYRIEAPDQPPVDVANATLRDNVLRYEIESMRHRRSVNLTGDNVVLQGDGARHLVKIQTMAGALPTGGVAKAGEGNLVLAPMPGLVTEIPVSVGDEVVAGQRVVVLEAMKLQQSLDAPCDGVIAEISCVAGENVDAGAVLSTIEPKENS